jgi:hypothetical protein
MLERIALTLVVLGAVACATPDQQVHVPRSMSVPAAPSATTPLSKQLRELFTATPDPSPERAQQDRLGRTKARPIAACGGRQSYDALATEVVCADGANPFGGDADKAAQARLGNVGANDSGHIIDVYEAKCPEGARYVFVDMYAVCSETAVSR